MIHLTKPITNASVLHLIEAWIGEAMQSEEIAEGVYYCAESLLETMDSNECRVTMTEAELAKHQAVWEMVNEVARKHFRRVQLIADGDADAADHVSVMNKHRRDE